MIIYVICLALCGCLAGCSGTEGGIEADQAHPSPQEETAQTSDPEDVPSCEGQIFAMDTYMSIKCYGEGCEEALEAARAEITRLEELLSVGIDTSEIAVINREGKGTVSKDTAEIIEKALEIWDTTDGAFDITIYPVMAEWGFTDGDFKVPDRDVLDGLLEHVGSGLIIYDKDASSVELGDALGIDLGGIAKGFTSDRLTQIFEERGLSGAVVSLGGNVQTFGVKPDGSLWKCGVTDPNDESGLLGIISITDRAVITSGAYERNFTDEASGKLYHHIIDPSTGVSAENGIISSTIVSKSGILADALSTACYVMGLDDSISYWRRYGDDFGMILMTDDGSLYVTEDIAGDFKGYYDVTVISR